MKRTLTITEITHDELVNLFSTGLYGSSYLDVDYPEGDYYDSNEDCYEDRIAKALLTGREIVVRDRYAEGCVYGNLPHEIEVNEDDGEEDVLYTITLEDVKRGLERAGSATFKINFDGEAEFATKAFNMFANEDLSFDLTYADCLMQIIVFNELIYG